MSAPLASFVPIDMSMTVLRSLAAHLLREGGVRCRRCRRRANPPRHRGLFVRATADSLTVTDRDLVLVSTDRRAAQSNPDCRIVLRRRHPHPGAVRRHPASADPDDEDGPQTEFTLDDQQMRPQIVGVYTALPAGVPRDGLSLHATIDTRYVLPHGAETRRDRPRCC